MCTWPYFQTRPHNIFFLFIFWANVSEISYHRLFVFLCLLNRTGNIRINQANVHICMLHILCIKWKSYMSFIYTYLLFWRQNDTCFSDIRDKIPSNHWSDAGFLDVRDKNPSNYWNGACFSDIRDKIPSNHLKNTIPLLSWCILQTLCALTNKLDVNMILIWSSWPSCSYGVHFNNRKMEHLKTIVFLSTWYFDRRHSAFTMF